MENFNVQSIDCIQWRVSGFEKQASWDSQKINTNKAKVPNLTSHRIVSIYRNEWIIKSASSSPSLLSDQQIHGPYANVGLCLRSCRTKVDEKKGQRSLWRPLRLAVSFNLSAVMTKMALILFGVVVPIRMPCHTLFNYGIWNSMQCMIFNVVVITTIVFSGMLLCAKHFRYTPC